MRQVIIIGFGGHAQSIIDSIGNKNMIFGYIDKNKKDCPYRYLGDDTQIADIVELYPEAGFMIGIGDLDIRNEIITRYDRFDVQFETIVDKSAIVSEESEIADGVYVGKGAVINAGAYVGRNCIVNTGAIVEHHCRIAKNTHLAPGCVLGGNVLIGSCSLIGLGATILNNILVGHNVIVGAGSVVVKDVIDNTKVHGVPATTKES